MPPFERGERKCVEKTYFRRKQRTTIKKSIIATCMVKSNWGVEEGGILATTYPPCPSVDPLTIRLLYAKWGCERPANEQKQCSWLALNQFHRSSRHFAHEVYKGQYLQAYMTSLVLYSWFCPSMHDRDVNRIKGKPQSSVFVCDMSATASELRGRIKLGLMPAFCVICRLEKQLMKEEDHNEKVKKETFMVFFLYSYNASFN
jgi:hypothetical protein